MAAWRYEISLLVLKNISLVRASSMYSYIAKLYRYFWNSLGAKTRLKSFFEVTNSVS